MKNKSELIELAELDLEKLKSSKFAPIEFDNNSITVDNLEKEAFEKYEFGYEKGKCCGIKRMICYKIRSNRNSWKNQCGCEFIYTVCPKCKKIISRELTIVT